MWIFHMTIKEQVQASWGVGEKNARGSHARHRARGMKKTHRSRDQSIRFHLNPFELCFKTCTDLHIATFSLLWDCTM